VKQAVAKLPLERRKIIATHDARPLAVAGVAMILAGLMEALQGFTADRIPDLPTALSGAAGALAGALTATLLTALLKRGEKSLGRISRG